PVLDGRPRRPAQVHAVPKPREDPLEGGTFVWPAQEAGAGCPPDLIPVTDVDGLKRLREGELLIDRGRKSLGAKRASKGDDGVHQRAGDLERIPSRRTHAASRAGSVPSGPCPRARSITSATPSRRTRSMSSWDFSSEPSERSVTLGSTPSAWSA